MVLSPIEEEPDLAGQMFKIRLLPYGWSFKPLDTEWVEKEPGYFRVCSLYVFLYAIILDRVKLKNAQYVNHESLGSERLVKDHMDFFGPAQTDGDGFDFFDNPKYPNLEPRANSLDEKMPCETLNVTIWRGACSIHIVMLQPHDRLRDPGIGECRGTGSGEPIELMKEDYCERKRTWRWRTRRRAGPRPGRPTAGPHGRPARNRPFRRLRVLEVRAQGSPRARDPML